MMHVLQQTSTSHYLNPQHTADIVAAATGAPRSLAGLDLHLYGLPRATPNPKALIVNLEFQILEHDFFKGV